VAAKNFTPATRARNTSRSATNSTDHRNNENKKFLAR
jgi:hypothetical protein